MVSNTPSGYKNKNNEKKESNNGILSEIEKIVYKYKLFTTAIITTGTLMTGIPGVENTGAKSAVAGIVSSMSESEFLSISNIRPQDIVEFNKLGPSEKQAIYDYYNLGIQKGLDNKKQRGLAIQLVSFFSSVKNNLDYINGRISRKDVSRYPIESIGKNVDRILGTNLGEKGKEIDNLIGRFVEEKGKQLDEDIRKLEESNKTLKLLIEALKQVK